MDNKKKKTILSVIAFSTIVLTMGILVIATFQGQSKTPQAGPKETTTSRAFYPLEPVPAPPLPALPSDTESEKEDDGGGEIRIDVMERPEEDIFYDEPIVKDFIVIPGIREEGQ